MKLLKKIAIFSVLVVALMIYRGTVQDLQHGEAYALNNYQPLNTPR